MITVIADDITGAAEMAGIGFRYGYKTCLMTMDGTTSLESLPECELLVCATDTRSMTADEASETSSRVADTLLKAGAVNFFKKTDSALRGHVEEELKALLEVLPYESVFYLPANPSKGRIIEHGHYTVAGVPLHETDFADDPEFPATTSNVFERFPLMRPWEVSSYSVSEFFTADMVSAFQMQFLLKEVNLTKVLLAGAADLFETLLRRLASEKRSLNPEEENPEDDGEEVALEPDLSSKEAEGVAEADEEPTPVNRTAPTTEFITKFKLPEQKPFPGLTSEKVLIVCGSTQSHSIEAEPFVVRQSIATKQMPEALFEGKETAEEWLKRLLPAWQQESAILTIGYPSKGGKSFAIRLRDTMAQVVEALLSQSLPDELIIEGGATAFTILKRLGWNRYLLTDEIAPGVVRMQSEVHPDCYVTLKPGSYPWGKLFE